MVVFHIYFAAAFTEISAVETGGGGDEGVLCILTREQA